jgi:ADP-heptose:LPS heptosyltransferase
MKTSQKLFIDRLAGLPVVILLNMMARLLGFFTRRNHSLKVVPEIIYVSKYVGMGSIIQATPLLQSLRQSFPNAKIIFITNQSNKILVSKFPFIDQCYTVDDSSILKLVFSSVKLVVKIFSIRKSAFIDLEVYSNFSTLITTMSCATNRIGFYRKDSSVRMGIYTHMLYLNIGHPISQSYLQMARLISASSINETLYDFDLSTDEKKEGSRKNIIKKINVRSEYIIINANASDLRTERRWQSENFILLVKEILKTDKKHTFVFIGNRNEKQYVKNIVGSFTEEEKNNIADTSGNLSLDELFHLVNGASLIITNDTGPMHIAFALCTPTFALFGPCQPEQYGNLKRTKSFYKKVYCSPCVHEFMNPPCKGNNVCMQKITVEEVLQAFNNHQFHADTELKRDALQIIYTDDANYPLGVVMR